MMTLEFKEKRTEKIDGVEFEIMDIELGGRYQGDFRRAWVDGSWSEWWGRWFLTEEETNENQKFLDNKFNELNGRKIRDDERY